MGEELVETWGQIYAGVEPRACGIDRVGATELMFIKR